MQWDALVEFGRLVMSGCSAGSSVDISGGDVFGVVTNCSVSMRGLRRGLSWDYVSRACENRVFLLAAKLADSVDDFPINRRSGEPSCTIVGALIMPIKRVRRLLQAGIALQNSES